MASFRKRINRAIVAVFCPQLRTTSIRTQGTLNGVDTLKLHVDALLLTNVRGFSTAFTTTLPSVAQLEPQLSPQAVGNFAATTFQFGRHQADISIP
jgi:hypothetical protein